MEKFLWSIWGQKIVREGIQLFTSGVVAVLSAPGVMETLSKAGFEFNPERFSLWFSGGLFLVIEGARNFAKVKLGVKWL